MELPVERQPHTVQSGRRFGARAGREGRAGRFQVVVDVFESRSPARSKGELDSGSGCPAWPQVETFFLRLGRVRTVDESTQ